jgi:hypothetical protein
MAQLGRLKGGLLLLLLLFVVFGKLGFRLLVLPKVICGTEEIVGVFIGVFIVVFIGVFD